MMERTNKPDAQHTADDFKVSVASECSWLLQEGIVA